MSGNQTIMIVGLVCCFCVILPLVIYGSLWGTNTLCDVKSSEKQEWIGIDCPSVYTGTAGESSSPSPPTDQSSSPSPSTDQSSSPSPSTDPCTGLTPTSLAKDVSVPCLQKTFKEAGCTTSGTAYPVDGFQGWWNSSPGGQGSPIYCSGGQVSGNNAGDCGAGNYATVKSDMNAWGTLTDAVHVEGCTGRKNVLRPGH